MGDVFEARDLWRSMGVPDQTPDKVDLRTVIRTMIDAARLRNEFALRAGAEVVSA